MMIPFWMRFLAIYGTSALIVAALVGWPLYEILRA